ncbi:MAG: condensation domain-containing protein [Butyribacter sp.]
MTVRKTAFEKTSSNKIIRKVYFDEKEESNKKKINSTKAETKIQRQLYDMIAEQIGNTEFGINDNFYERGLDSLGSSVLITELSEKINVNITLSELMENADILKLEALIKSKTKQKKTIDEDAENKTVKEVYPLTAMQKYFAYIIPDNTTGNLPFVFRMDKTVETDRLIKAIGIVLDAHPSLKAIVRPTEQKYYAIYRDDNRNIDIGVEKIQDKDAEKKMQELIVPFKYRENDNLVHIHVFEGEKFNYMFFDVAHFMGDGVSMNILMEDLCAAYKGEKVEKENIQLLIILPRNKKELKMECVTGI